MKIPKFNSLTSKIVLIAVLAGLAWATSITNEYVGYDDIKLIVRNERIHKDIGYAITFYTNVVSDSHNVAWTNYPTVIYRPLEWVGSSLGYHIWGIRSWAFHLFVNYNFHILCSILLFFILSKIFFTPLKGSTELNIEEAQTEIDKEKLANQKIKSKNLKSNLKQKFTSKKINDTKKINPVSWWIPLAIIAVWTVHPLHNEAINMLTSGVGFLFATILCLIAITINLYVKDLKSISGILLIALAWGTAFIGYHGSEMTVIAPFMLLLIFSRSLRGIDFRSYKHELIKIFLSFTTFYVYIAHRSEIVSEKKEWLANGIGEFYERLFVLAPQIFFHYIKLFFYPANLTVDEHHNVILENAYSLYHILCFAVAAAFVIGVFYFLYIKEDNYRLHNKLISGSLFFTGFSIAISLNIIPLYVLARDRYTYFFTLGLVCTIFLLLDKYLFTRISDETLKIKSIKKASIIIGVIIVALGIRSTIRSLDWSNGEKFWNSTIDSIDDVGAKQNWRYRLMQYYLDPGTDTFKANETLKNKTFSDFFNFAQNESLFQRNVMESYIRKSIDPKSYIKNKYSYIGNKTISSGLFFIATEKLKQGDRREAMKYFEAAHIYFPQHFQTNLQFFIHTYGGNNDLTEKLLKLLYADAVKNSFLAKGLMDAMFFVKYPQIFKYADELRKLFPNTQVFSVYAFHSAYMEKRYDEAYELAKNIVKKYHEQDIFEKYITAYETGTLRR
jgi:hypothetical protein